MQLSNRARWVLLIGDILALLFFVAEGQREHETLDPLNPLFGILLTALYYAPVWALVAWVLGAYPRDRLSTRRLLMRSLNAWLVAAPLATLVRAYALNRAVIPTLFLAVSLAVGGALLLGWRALFTWLMSRRQSAG